MNSRFTMAVHMLAMVACQERVGQGPVTSEEMAKSIQTNPVVVRRLMRDLTRAGLVETKRGVGGGVTLARSPSRITLCDVYAAVSEEAELFGRHPSGPSEACAVASQIAEYLERVYGRAEAALKESLGATTLEQMAADLTARGKACASEKQAARS